jgi:hypothetical protein
MKTKYLIAPILLLIASLYGCKKDFVETNTNPVLPTTIEPVYQLVASQIIAINIVHYYGTIVQQAQNLLGGAEEAGNRNSNVDNFGSNTFNTLYQTQVQNMVDIINRVKDDPARTNIYSMARILKAYSFQMLVDAYGDVPYSEAGLSYLKGIILPKYDDQKVIYEDIAKELKEAVDALDASKDKVPGEMYFGGDIPKWKKFGNSLLLRVGMRYTKLDETKAKSLVQTATDPARGGVMSSNDDNVVLKANSIQVNPATGFINGSVRHIWFIGKPFIDLLKINNDPRLKYTAVLYPDPSASNPTGGNTNPASQIGVPYGYTDVNIVNAPDFPGKVGSTFKYSQFNRSTVGRIDGWLYYVTYAQTQLLLAEARQRGYITTGTAKDYYEAGIRGHMTQRDMWATTNGGPSPITTGEQDAYLLEPNIVFNAATALKQINEQYWVASLMIWAEAYANFRRSGYPQLSPLNFPGEDPFVTGGDGFIHRLPYPLKEWSVNRTNVQEATDRIGGDNLGVRVFWDKK